MNEHGEISGGDVMDTIATRMMMQLRDAIVRLDLKPGDTISEAEVAEHYGVSRQPVREAFIRLGQQGLLLIRPKRATMVKRISEEGVGQSRFIREAIEVEIIRRAAAATNAATAPMLEGLLAQQHEQAEGEQRHEGGGGRPEVDAQGVQVLAHRQGLQLPVPGLIHLHRHNNDCQKRGNKGSCLQLICNHGRFSKGGRGTGRGEGGI